MSQFCARRSLATLAAIATLGACTSLRPERTTIPERGARDVGLSLRRDRDRLTAREIAVNPGLPTAYDAVELLRHEFLQRTTRGRRPEPESTLTSVFVNGTPSGGIHTLRTIPASLVAEISFVSAAEAHSRFGAAYPGGIILVTLSK